MTADRCPLTADLRPPSRVAILTAGRDKPYALGLAAALGAEGVYYDFIGSDDIRVSEGPDYPGARFLNFRGSQSAAAGPVRKMTRVLTYYSRLIRYALTAEPRIFHILWNNKFEWFDRTLLMLWYKLAGRRLVLTAHNVNAGKRDGNDSWWNRLTLRIQYRLADHLFVHTTGMKAELIAEFGVPGAKVTVIPFGINNTVPNTELTRSDARVRLGLDPTDKALLFFGNIAPYKGLGCLIAAFTEVLKQDPTVRLIIAGKPKGCDEYWRQMQQAAALAGVSGRIIEKIEYIPDEETEIYFKAADALVLPYSHVFQSGVLFLSYSFGLPVIASDLDCLKEEIVEGKSGLVFRANDPHDLATVIEAFFSCPLHRQPGPTREWIRQFANHRYSWSTVAQLTAEVYAVLAGARPSAVPGSCECTRASS